MWFLKSWWPRLKSHASSISARRVPRSYCDRRRRCSSRKFCPALGAKRPAKHPCKLPMKDQQLLRYLPTCSAFSTLRRILEGLSGPGNLSSVPATGPWPVWNIWISLALKPRMKTSLLPLVGMMDARASQSCYGTSAQDSLYLESLSTTVSWAYKIEKSAY